MHLYGNLEAASASATPSENSILASATSLKILSSASSKASVMVSWSAR